MRGLVSGVKSAFTALAVVFVAAVALLLVVATILVGIGTIVGYAGNFATSPPPSSSDAPTAAFDVGLAGDEATIVHEGGDDVPADELLVGVDGQARGTWAEHEGTAAAGTVTEGDSITVADVDEGDEVAVHWIGGGGTVELSVETARP